MLRRLCGWPEQLQPVQPVQTAACEACVALPQGNPCPGATQPSERELPLPSRCDLTG